MTTGPDGPDRWSVLQAFSRGELTTSEVTAALGLGYSAVLDLLAAEGLPRYRVPDDVARPMIDDFLALLGDRSQGRSR